MVKGQRLGLEVKMDRMVSDYRQDDTATMLNVLIGRVLYVQS